MHFQTVQDKKYTSVRTSRTEDWRSSRCFCSLFQFQFLLQDRFTEHIGTVFALYRKDLLADCLDTPGFYLRLDHRIQFLYNIECINFFCKVLDQLSWERIHHSQLQYRSLRQCFFYILIRDSAGNNSDLCIVHFNFIDWKSIGCLCQFLVQTFDFDMSLLCISRHHDIFLNILYIFLIFYIFTLTKLNQSLRMCQSRCRSENKRAVKLLAEFKSCLKEIFCLGTVGRFDDRDLCCSCNHSCILLVLRAVKSRIIRNNKNKSTVYSHIRY